MDEFLILLLVLIVGAAILAGIVLPIIALVISIRSRKRLEEHLSRIEAARVSAEVGSHEQFPSSDDVSLAAAIRQLSARIEKLEAATTPRAVAHEFDDKHIEPRPKEPAETERVSQRLPAQQPPVAVPSSAARTTRAEGIESIIGRRWLGWAAVGLILFATAFFLKYTFDNRWIGELGRVAIGVAAGVALTALGFKYHRRRWRVFSQILTGGGVVLLYLSAYAAFGYYHLATQQAAFAYLAILVAEAAGLAYLYEAPAIAIVALLGGFLTPILLRSDRDQYRSLFGYIALLDVGALAMLKRWRGLSSLAFGGTHLLFWLWYQGNYHPRKLGAVMAFQSAVFVIFLLSQLGRQLIRHLSATFEDQVLLLINPFVFFATAYHLLNDHYHDWMGVFAIGMALVYASATKLLLNRSATTPNQSLLMIAVALTFVTLAIPIQLRSNWITIAWSVEGLAILWAGIETREQRLRALGCAVFGLSVLRLVFRDTRFDSRPMFTPVLNKYFLSSLAVTACLFGAAALYKRSGERRGISAPKLELMILLVAIAAFWFVISVETHTYFEAHASAEKVAEFARHERWLGQMALSVLWSVYAGGLAAVGFIRRTAGVRWAALALFGLTVIKVMLVDIAELRQFYRIIAFLVLGMLLLAVAWGYQRAFHFKESPK